MNNDDLISREALRNEVDTWGCNDYDKYDFLEAIDNAPTVEPTIKPICEVKFDKEQLHEIVDKAKAEVLASIERQQDRWGKWSLSEIQCPNCLEYFQTDCYSKEELNKCPICGADMRKGE